jgi:probable phosphoglycerate mutase
MQCKNTYYIMRHGESDANVTRLIVSDPLAGVQSYGLTDKGKTDVGKAIEESGLTSAVDIVYTSEFMRARQTAEIVAKLCGAELKTTPHLRERFFGEYDRLGDEHYRAVWEKDAGNSHNNTRGVESTFEVARRLKRLIINCEKSYSGKTILLVSHGDPLQILMAIAGGSPPHSHREVGHLDKAEIRELIIENEMMLEEVAP